MVGFFNKNLRADFSRAKLYCSFFQQELPNVSEAIFLYNLFFKALNGSIKSYVLLLFLHYLLIYRTYDIVLRHKLCRAV